jgi:hypothetical protein
MSVKTLNNFSEFSPMKCLKKSVDNCCNSSHLLKEYVNFPAAVRDDYSTLFRSAGVNIRKSDIFKQQSTRKGLSSKNIFSFILQIRREP